MADQSDSAVSGGLLVVLGIIVALGIGYFFYTKNQGAGGPDITVNVPSPTKSVTQ